MWATVIPGNNWLTYIGRLAFPIYAFQIAEGFFHTADRKKYVRRLLILACISEIPYNLMVMSSPVFPFHQNTVFTLLLGLWAISALDRLRQDKSAAAVLKAVFTALAACLLGTITFVDYGLWGVVTVILFYLLRDFPGAKLLQLLSLGVLNLFLFEGQRIPLLGIEFPTQGFALLALPLIWMYNGEKGSSQKAFQYGAYAFYPAHMLLLSLLRLLL
jgi:hypothetical protein